jgi:hypothetical protein
MLKVFSCQKLAIVAEEFQRFLRMIAEDVGYESLKSGWQAADAARRLVSLRAT